MYLAKKMAGMPLVAIGQKLDRTHATVIHGVGSVENRMACEKKFASEVDAIEAAISSVAVR